MKRLHKETSAAIVEFQGNIKNTIFLLTSARNEAVMYFHEKSETWQASETGADYRAWIEALGEKINELEELMGFDVPEMPINS